MQRLPFGKAYVLIISSCILSIRFVLFLLKYFLKMNTATGTTAIATIRSDTTIPATVPTPMPPSLPVVVPITAGDGLLTVLEAMVINVNVEVLSGIGLGRLMPAPVQQFGIGNSSRDVS